MRIGLFTDTYIPDINGVVTSIVTLQKALEEMGHEVYVITNHPSPTKTFVEDNIIYLPGIELKFLYGYTMSSPLHLQALNVIETLNLDIVHIHTEFGVGLFGRVVAKQLSLPMVTTYHTQYEGVTHYVNILNLKMVDKLSKKAVAFLSKAYSKNVQIIIAPSEKTQSMLMRYGIRKEIVVIPTGLDLKKFERVDTNFNIKLLKKLNLENKFIFNFTGRLAEEKSIDIVIKVFSKIIEKYDDVHLMIVGDGPEKSKLVEQVKDLNIEKYVTFVGKVAQVDLAPYYQISDGFISASVVETQGLTIIEAMANELAVFARYDEPLESLVEHGVSGYYYEDEDTFLECVNNYFQKSLKEKETMKRQAKSKIDKYDSRIFGKKVMEVYQKAIDQYFGKFVITDIYNVNDKKGIVVSNGEYEDIFIFDEDILVEKGLKIGMDLSRNKIIDLESEQKYHEAYQLALRRLARRDYTGFELREYLKSKISIGDDELDQIIADLEKRRFVDDNRYMMDKISYHRDQLRGNGWILKDLYKRGFSFEEVQSELDHEEPEAYLERAVMRSKRFLKTLKDGSKMQRENKLKQHLYRQGFESEIIKVIELDEVDVYDKEDELESLKNEMSKAYRRYRRKDDPKTAKDKVFKYAMNRGYRYDMIKEVIKEIELEYEED